MSMRQDGQTVITSRPSAWQFFINELPLLFLCLASLIAGGLPDCAYSTLLLVVALVLSLCLLYRFAYLRSIRYHVGSEQLIREHGVFQRSVDYMELYRVVDFAERQTLPQQLLGLKSVTIFSMDRSTPRLELTGMTNKQDIVSLIRQRSETNKRRKGIYEITNR